MTWPPLLIIKTLYKVYIIAPLFPSLYPPNKDPTKASLAKEQLYKSMKTKLYSCSLPPIMTTELRSLHLHQSE